MHDDVTLTRDRWRRVLRERVFPAIHGPNEPLTVEVWHAPGEPVTPAEGIAGEFAPVSVGERWGRPWGTSWFRFTTKVPASWRGTTVEALIDLGFDGAGPGFSAEGLVHLPDGSPVKGLHPRNHWVRFGDVAGEHLEFYVEAASNPEIRGPVTPLGDLSTAGDEPLYRLRRADIAVFQAEVFELAHDLEVAGELADALPESSPRRAQLWRAIGQCLDALDLAEVAGSAERARQQLTTALSVTASESTHTLWAVGHAHIDSAWLWPLRETVRKVARTASNVVNLMDDHPELVFAMSQAQQLAWIAEHRPELYERVREHVEGGQFVPVGGMWVESDTNMPGSEAMARQFVYGKRFFLDEFGIDTQEVWLPDSFGYSAALPQLVALSGSRWFLTQKISWSATNPFPHHTFWWEGLDGTRIFTHFPPVDTYNADLNGAQVAHAVANFRDKGTATMSLVPFGHGDGGGGPTREMLARAGRLADLDGSARVRIAPPAEFFAAAEAEYPDAPVWVGELYLELHRATYTSQAATKRGNRRSEHLLREAELWSATAAATGFDYPYDELESVWKTVLLHQFHDILPGSSIAWVHREARATYADVERRLTTIIDAAVRHLVGDGTRTIVFNGAPHSRAGVPAGGATAHGVIDGADVSIVEIDNGWVLDNGLITVTVDRRGLITSAIDVAADRDAIAPGGAANLLQLHPDLPNRWDAWDVDAFYRNQVTNLVDVESIGLIDSGPDAVTLRIERRFGESSIIQHVSLVRGARRIDIDTTVDWHETETFLKASFDVDVRAAESAAETQFGHVRRPTHQNTSWEAAKFEICAHRFLHVSEPGWGAALVNDSTYGHDVTRAVRDDNGTTTTVRLSLLRAPRYPDPDTDQGEHRMRYSFVIGADIVDAVREGYRINLPERVTHGGQDVEPLVAVNNDQVVVEAIKLADDRSGDVIIRLYESTGGRSTAMLRFGVPVASATTTDLLERDLPGGNIDVDENAISITLRPFQILTIRLALR